jgi:hypothetical protein
MTDGSELLDDVQAFLGRFVAYPSVHALAAHTLWTVHTHLMDVWDSTPRIAFLSPEPGSGKSRALEVTELLVPRPVLSVNTTPAYLFRKVSDEAGAPTLLYDEIDTVFGPKAKDNEDIRGMLNAGHRKGATAGRCVMRGKLQETEDLPAYCAVALAGLDDLPDTIASRSITVRMRRRAPHEKIEPFRRRINAPEGRALHERIGNWARSIKDRITDASTWPMPPTGIEDRDADVWESLLVIGATAGGHWPETSRCAAVSLVTDSKRATTTFGVRLLADLRTAFGAAGKLSTEDALSFLTELDEAPWGDLRGKPLDARGLARRLAKYEVKSKSVRIGDRTCKGYDRADLDDTWSRYLPDVSDNDAAYEKKPNSYKADVQSEALPTADAVPMARDVGVTSETPKQSELEIGAALTGEQCARCTKPLLLPGRTFCEACRIADERGEAPSG